MIALVLVKFVKRSYFSFNNHEVNKYAILFFVVKQKKYDWEYYEFILRLQLMCENWSFNLTVLANVCKHLLKISIEEFFITEECTSDLHFI